MWNLNKGVVTVMEYLTTSSILNEKVNSWVGDREIIIVDNVSLRLGGHQLRSRPLPVPHLPPHLSNSYPDISDETVDDGWF